MKINQFVIIAICSMGLLTAQKGRDHKHRGGEKMRMMAVWKMTEHLDLKEDQAEKFFPRYRSHEEKLKSIRTQQRDVFKPLKEKIRSDEDVTATDVSAALDALTKLENQRIKQQEDFVKGMKDILTPKQQLKLLTFRAEMLKDVKGRIKDHRKPFHRDKRKDSRY